MREYSSTQNTNVEQFSSFTSIKMKTSVTLTESYMESVAEGRGVIIFVILKKNVRFWRLSIFDQ